MLLPSCVQANACSPLNRFVFNNADVEDNRFLSNPQTTAKYVINNESIMNA